MVEVGKLRIKHKYIDKEIKARVKVLISKSTIHIPYSLEINFGKKYPCSGGDMYELFAPLKMEGELWKQKLRATAEGDILTTSFERFTELEEFINKLSNYKGKTRLLEAKGLEENKGWKAKLFMEVV